MLSWCICKRSLLVIFTVLQLSKCDVAISTHQIQIGVHETQVFNITVTNLNTSNAELEFYNQYEDLVRTVPQRIALQPGIETYKINVTGLGAGHSTLTTLATENVNVDDAYVIVTIYKSSVLDVISIIIGWMYFATWSISFYPQIFTNFQRKSVVGLNFDYLALNVVGYVSYTIFTLCLYYVPVVIDEYLERHPRGLIPVTVSDNAFNIHGLLAILFTIFQCIVYERGSQKISIVASIILGLFGLFYGVGIALAISNYIHWLDFLYFCSYIKLLITLLKYVPQALLNYKRKSTDGWSIGGVFLDLAGGLFSILQMILDAHNYDDWKAIFGNASKFGLGLFSILFQIIFIAQHYLLYKH